MVSPIKAILLKLERDVSMIMEVRELLSQGILDTSGHTSGNTTPERPNLMVIVTPPPHKLRDLSGLVDTSSQMSTPDDTEMAEMVEAPLEEIPSLTVDIPGPNAGAPLTDASYLPEEANKALEELLATKSSINTHQWKLVWELGMSLCWNDSKTTESIKEAKAICTHSTQETLCSTTVKEAKATCTHSVQEVKTLCSKTIRDVEAWGASQADSLHQTHTKSIQHLEEQAIQEESKSHLYFFFTCQAATQASAVELRGMLVASYHILMGQAPISHPFNISPGASSTEQVSAPVAPSPSVPGHSSRPKWQHPSPDPLDILPPSGTTSKATLEGPFSSKQWEIPPSHKVLMWSHQEAFSLVHQSDEGRKGGVLWKALLQIHSWEHPWSIRCLLAHGPDH